MSILSSQIGKRAFEKLTPEQQKLFVKRLASELEKEGKDLSEVKQLFPDHLR